MAIKTRIDPMERDIALLLPEAFSPKERSKAFADYARTALVDAQEQNRRVLGRVPSHETYVDGRHDAPLESVKPDGTIVFEFELLLEQFAWIAEQLEKHSPVGRSGGERPGHPGLYQRSHVFLADGVVVEPEAVAPAASEYVFVNIQPYARKLEGSPSRPPLSLQAPHGVYQVVAALAQGRFGNLATVRFGYRTPLSGAINQWANTTKMASPGRRGAKREEWLRRQPAIVISLR